MKKYRIVTNGLNYRVQWLGKTFFLRRQKWYWLHCSLWGGSWFDEIAEFDSKPDAMHGITKARKQEKAEVQGYISI